MALVLPRGYAQHPRIGVNTDMVIQHTDNTTRH
jgi:hypothetical protein